jgi:hypothetical protein
LKNGSLQLASLDSATIVETVQGHEENQSIWTMCMTPDRVNLGDFCGNLVLNVWFFSNRF